MERRVKPEDNIPVRMLEPEAIESRKLAMTNKKLSKKGESQLRVALLSLNGKAVNADVMEKFYRHLDSYLRLEVQPYSICTKGCDQCCHVRVDVSLLEAWYISEMSGVELDVEPMQNKVQGRNAEVPCPFLKDGGCSIYKYRPIACRMFNAIDHWKHCYANEQHSVFTIMSQPEVAELQGHLMRSGHEDVGSSWADIRQWFPPAK
ncbi:YkgJ family cysteine cluster protein [Vibrio crassostreae]|uniref:YkgJ family cysteine cluster protein n=1 Tax=Vibrio crassostreae TaxID=246167 RepID=UPI001B306520|nr:YkgJ family cysteine cluster protein [Vibrio crassostreae]